MFLFDVRDKQSLDYLLIGMGTPALTKIVQTFSPSARGSVWSAITFAGNIGYMGSPFVMIPFLAFGWRVLFKGCAGVAVAVSIVSFFVISETPSTSAKLEAFTVTEIEPVSPMKYWRSFFQLDLWLWLFSEAFTTFTLTGIVSWAGLYFMEHLGLPKEQAAQLILYSEVGTLAGVALCGPVSDLLRGRRDVTSALFAALCVPPLLSLASRPSPASTEALVSEYLWLSVAMLLVGVTINGPKTLATVGVRESVPEEIGGSVCGLLGLLGQLGGAVAGAPLGHVIEVFGWSYLPVVLGSSMACSSGCLALIAIRRKNFPLGRSRGFKQE